MPLFIFVPLTPSFMFLPTVWTYKQLGSPAVSAKRQGMSPDTGLARTAQQTRQTPPAARGCARPGCGPDGRSHVGQARCGTAPTHLHLSTCTIKSRSVQSFLTCSRLATVVTGTY